MARSGASAGRLLQFDGVLLEIGEGDVRIDHADNYVVLLQLFPRRQADAYKRSY
jgi:hypothetical protein